MLKLVRRAVMTAYVVITLITGHIIGSAEVVDLVAKIGSLLH